LRANSACLTGLAQGVLLSEIMKQISPTFFDIDLSQGTSWAGHKMNNAHLIRGLEEYYRSEHDKDFVLMDILNLDRLSQEHNLEDLFVLSEFIVGAAVQCADKQHYINNIMSMSEESQGTLMNLAKSLMQRVPSAKECQIKTCDDGYIEEEKTTFHENFEALRSENSHLLKLKEEAEAKMRCTV
jgi:hypothetical protein